MKTRMFRVTLTALAVFSLATLGTAWAVMSSAWEHYSAVAEVANWDDVSVPDGDVDYYNLRRVVTTVQRIVIQRGPLTPSYAISLGVDVPTMAGAGCSDNTVVFVPTGDGDLTDSLDEDVAWQIVDSAKLALVTGKQVAVVISPNVTRPTATGCLRPMVVRLSVLANS